MNSVLKSSLGHALLLPALLLALLLPPVFAAGEAAKEPLPVTVFKNLQAGKPQSVVVFGTSLSMKGEWAKALQKYFDKQFPGLVTFTNAASSGKNSDWGRSKLDSLVSKNPDLVFIEFSVNDASTKFNISQEKSAANLDKIVKAVRQQNPQADIVLQTMNTAWDAPDEPSQKKYASDRPQLEAYYDLYRKYARAHELPLVDNYPNWLKLQQEDEAKFKKWLPDGLHPIPEASLAVTWPAIEALLERARAAAGQQ